MPEAAKNLTTRVSTCGYCGARVMGSGTRGPVPEVCPDCFARRQLIWSIHTAARLARRLGLEVVVKELTAAGLVVVDTDRLARRTRPTGE